MTMRQPRRPNPKKPLPRHPSIKSASGRRFPCYPAAVLAFIVDNWDRCLLLRKPGHTGWEVVSGALEEGETVPEAVIREVREEAGPAVQAVYLGVLDTFTFIFDARLPRRLTPLAAEYGRSLVVGARIGPFITFESLNDGLAYVSAQPAGVPLGLALKDRKSVV